MNDPTRRKELRTTHVFHGMSLLQGVGTQEGVSLLKRGSSSGTCIYTSWIAHQSCLSRYKQVSEMAPPPGGGVLAGSHVLAERARGVREAGIHSGL